MTKASKATMAAEEMARALLAALKKLASGNSVLQPGRKVGTRMTGHGCTAGQVRDLEGYGCAKVSGREKVGVGYRLEAKATAFGRRVAKAG